MTRGSDAITTRLPRQLRPPSNQSPLSCVHFLFVSNLLEVAFYSVLGHRKSLALSGGGVEVRASPHACTGRCPNCRGGRGGGGGTPLPIPRIFFLWWGWRGGPRPSTPLLFIQACQSPHPPRSQPVPSKQPFPMPHCLS